MLKKLRNVGLCLLVLALLPVVFPGCNSGGGGRGNAGPTAPPPPPPPPPPTDLTFNMTWGLAGTPGVTTDLDLVVVEPDGTPLFWANPGPSSTGGVYLQDCQCDPACRLEEVSWDDAPAGTYEFGAIFNPCPGLPLGLRWPFTIEILRGGEVIRTRSGFLSANETTRVFTTTIGEADAAQDSQRAVRFEAFDPPSKPGYPRR